MRNKPWSAYPTVGDYLASLAADMRQRGYDPTTYRAGDPPRDMARARRDARGERQLLSRLAARERKRAAHPDAVARGPRRSTVAARTLAQG